MPTKPTQSPDRLADRFVAWMIEHDLAAREWTVDETWWLASEDFAPALDFTMPARRAFLGALQRVAGVSVAYDRRVGRPANGKWRKTTFYKFAAMVEPTRAAA